MLLGVELLHFLAGARGDRKKGTSFANSFLLPLSTLGMTPRPSIKQTHTDLGWDKKEMTWPTRITQPKRKASWEATVNSPGPEAHLYVAPWETECTELEPTQLSRKSAQSSPGQRCPVEMQVPSPVCPQIPKSAS